MQTSELVLFVGVVLAIPLTFLWMAVHVHGLFKLGGALGGISRRAGIAWLLAGAGGFMGPCVIPVSLAAMVLAIIERRRGEVDPHTAIALRTVIVSGVVILVMAAELTLAALLSVFFQSVVF
jgi:hypothetical protein